MSCAFRAATAYTLGLVAHASTHPVVSVSPGCSPMKYGFLMFFSRLVAAAPFGSVLSAEIGESTGIRFPPTASLSCFHADGDGHAGSVGRRRLKFVLANNRRGKIGINAADPI